MLSMLTPSNRSTTNQKIKNIPNGPQEPPQSSSTNVAKMAVAEPVPKQQEKFDPGM